MKSIFEASDNAELVTRIRTLRPGAKPQWGKMDVAQMLAHCQTPARTCSRAARTPSSGP